MVAISSLGDTCSPSGMPVIRCSQAASPLLLIGKDMWVFLLLLWLEELTGRPLGWWTQALTACGKLFPKSMHASFGRGDRPSLSLAQSQRESGYEVFPRNNPQDAWWWGCRYDKFQIIQFLFRKPTALSKHRMGLSHKSSCCVLCRERAVSQKWQGSTGEEVGDGREGAVRESRESWACPMVVWKSYGQISRIIGSPEL